MRRLRRDEKGFTLVELMMAATITIILTSFGIYNFLGQLPGYRLRSTANRLAATIQYLKIRAVATNRYAWLKVDWSNPDSNYFTGFVDDPALGAPTLPTASEYAAAGLDLPDSVGGAPVFKLPNGVTFGFPTGYNPGTVDLGPDDTEPGAGNFINTPDHFLGYRATGVPVVNAAAGGATANEPAVIFLKNNKGEGYAISVQITGRVRVWKWTQGGWR